jgi:hypothetical protein
MSDFLLRARIAHRAIIAFADGAAGIVVLALDAVATATVRRTVWLAFTATATGCIRLCGSCWSICATLVVIFTLGVVALLAARRTEGLAITTTTA